MVVSKEVYSIFLNPQQNLGEKIPGVGGICSKGLFDLLILPLIARKILWDSLLFLSNPNHYQFSGDMNDLIKLICWLALLPAILLALATETVKNLSQLHYYQQVLSCWLAPRYFWRLYF